MRAAGLFENCVSMNEGIGGTIKDICDIRLADCCSAIKELNLRTIVIIGLITTLHSCCPFIKEEHVGNNLYLSEYDDVDRRILYSNESARGVE